MAASLFRLPSVFLVSSFCLAAPEDGQALTIGRESRALGGYDAGARADWRERFVMGRGLRRGYLRDIERVRSLGALGDGMGVEPMIAVKREVGGAEVYRAEGGVR